MIWFHLSHWTQLNTVTNCEHVSCQVVLIVPSKVGDWRMCNCTGSTFTVNWWWSALHLVAFFTCGMRRSVQRSFLQTNTRCVCKPKPWAKPRTASWGSSSSNTRLSLIWTPKNRWTEKYNELSCLWFHHNWRLLTIITTYISLKKDRSQPHSYAEKPNKSSLGSTKRTVEPGSRWAAIYLDLLGCVERGERKDEHQEATNKTTDNIYGEHDQAGIPVPPADRVWTSQPAVHLTWRTRVI